MPNLKSNSKLQEKLIHLINDDKFRLGILDCINQISDQNLWIAGGFIRNLVWDSLHNYKIRTPLDDIDVFYFDKETLSRQQESHIKEKLIKCEPSVNWSVKNQARMHQPNNDKQYQNLTDALFKFPESASAVAVRKNKNGDFDILAPYGLSDLFDLRVAPTPYCRSNTITYNKFMQRITEKEWQKIWPNLKIEL